MSLRQLQMVSITLFLGYPALAFAVGARGPHWISLVIILCTLAYLWGYEVIDYRRWRKRTDAEIQARVEEEILIREKRIDEMAKALTAARQDLIHLGAQDSDVSGIIPHIDRAIHGAKGNGGQRLG